MTTAFKTGNFQNGQTITTVSRQWLARPADEKFTSLDDLRSAVAARREAAFERRIDTKGLEFLAPEPTKIEDTHDMSVGLPSGEILGPSHWSFGQLANLAKAPAGYLRTLPSQIAADALSYGMRYNREVDEVKLYAANGSLLAATGPEYGRIFDEEVVAAVQQVAGNGTGDSRWKIPGTLNWSTMVYDPETPVTPDTTTLFASDRDVFMFLVDDRNPIEVGKLPSGDPDLMFRGFYVTNSEVGRGSLRLAAFYLRAVCCNRILWGVERFEEITMRHTKLAPSRFIEQARPALSSFANGSERTLLEGIQRAKEAKVASDDEQMMEFLQGRKLSRQRSIDIMETVEREEGRPARTIWDIAQGMTAVARSIPSTDNRIELEGEARKLLDKVAA
jgi:hypothetical protein